MVNRCYLNGIFYEMIVELLEGKYVVEYIIVRVWEIEKI